MVKCRVNSGTRVGGSDVNLVVSSKSVAFTRWQHGARFVVNRVTACIIYKKTEAIYSMLYKQLYKTAKIKKYKHEHVLAYTFNLPSVARINV